MMTHAYSETYLDGAMDNLGNMLDYAVNDFGQNIEMFYDQFLLSGIAEEFGEGNPKFVAGLSGPELASEISVRTTGSRLTKQPSEVIEKTPEYWVGWALAWYQWYSGKSFDALKQYGLTPTRMLQLYPTLHEADLSKLARVADDLIKSRPQQTTNLKCVREARGFSQRDLAEHSDVTLRSIQLYEQRQNDINKAQASTLASLAKALGCRMEDLLEDYAWGP